MAKYISAFETSYLVRLENAMDYSDLGYQLLKVQDFGIADWAGFLIFLLSIHQRLSPTRTIKSNILFSERLQKDLPSALKYFAQIVTNFLLLSAEHMKNEPCLTF